MRTSPHRSGVNLIQFFGLLLRGLLEPETFLFLQTGSKANRRVGAAFRA